MTLFRATFLILDPVCRGGKRREQCGHSECPSDRLKGSRQSRKDKKMNGNFHSRKGWGRVKTSVIFHSS